MKQGTKRTLSMILLSAMIAGTVSCGSGSGDTENTTASGNDSQPDITEPVDPIAEREAMDDELPDITYDNAPFTIAVETDFDWTILQDEASGDVIDDAIYKRNLAVEDRFKIELQLVTGDHASLNSKISNIVQSGDDSLDLCMTHVIQTGNIALNGLFVNWYDVPYVNFEKPWWSASNIENMTVNNVCLLAVGDCVLSALSGTYCVLYNKRLAEDYDLGDIYGIVNDGKWTIDKALELTKDTYSDLNSNGEIDSEDLFGYVSIQYSPINAYLWAFGGHVLQRSESDGIELVYHSEKTNDMVQKLCSFFYDNSGIYLYTNDANYDYNFSVKCFRDGRAVFINSLLGATVDTLRDMKDDFGVIPYPKWDEAQENYSTMVDGFHEVLCIPVTAPDLERSGIITEALCAESYKKVMPAYYETALKTKYTRDSESIAMIDLVVNSRVFDLGYFYDGWKGASFIFERLVHDNNTNFESYWAANESSITTHYQKVIDYFENYGE